MKVLTNLY